jgi:hypothetical protein
MQSRSCAREKEIRHYSHDMANITGALWLGVGPSSLPTHTRCWLIFVAATAVYCMTCTQNMLDLPRRMCMVLQV